MNPLYRAQTFSFSGPPWFLAIATSEFPLITFYVFLNPAFKEDPVFRLDLLEAKDFVKHWEFSQVFPEYWMKQWKTPVGLV
jgi:hypothetical protein